MAPSIRQRAIEALKEPLITEGKRLDQDSRLARWEDNFVATVSKEQLVKIRRDLERGDGGELLKTGTKQPKMNSAYSSAALAVNSFAPWLGREHELPLGGFEGFFSIRFERKCPTGAAGKPPNLDLLAEDAPRYVVGVESKCTEYLSGHDPKFSTAYDARVQHLAHSSWKKLFKELKTPRHPFNHLDVAQLVKHYLGMKHTFGNTRMTLLYLYWMPTNADELDVFKQHQLEIRELKKRVRDPRVRFAARSYPELWKEWASTEASWLKAHAAALSERYEVPI